MIDEIASRTAVLLSPPVTFPQEKEPLTGAPKNLPITRVRSLFMPYGNLPHSVRSRNDLPIHSNVLFHWFRVNRAEPVSSYRNLILGYANLAPADRDLSQALVDEMFVDAEFQLLKAYLLRRHGQDTRTTMVTAPIFATRSRNSPRRGEGRPFLPYSASKTIDEDAPTALATANFVESNTSGFYPLSEEEGYDLPFTVWGFYGPGGSTRA